MNRVVVVWHFCSIAQPCIVRRQVLQLWRVNSTVYLTERVLSILSLEYYEFQHILNVLSGEPRRCQ